MRLELRVISDRGRQKFTIEAGENLLDVLSRYGYDIGAVCGGKASCYKCKVEFVDPVKPPTPKDISGLSKKELDENIRLACANFIWEDSTVRVKDASKMEVLLAAKEPEIRQQSTSGHEHLVVDIGTTTLALVLVDSSGKVIEAHGRKNAQAPYGADVISRIKHASQGGLPDLNKAIIGQINLILKSMKNLNLDRLTSMTVLGNTTMLHLFLGKDCSGLGFHPYQGEFLATQETRGKALGLDLDLPVKTMPNISSFAGSDLTAGILSLTDKSEKYKLLVDLGTNAEIALFKKDKFFAASAAAGPAFEGAGIKQGMPAIAGAISSFSLVNGVTRIKTIGNLLPVGICGSGLIDIVAQLLENRLLDETGHMLLGPQFEVAENVYIYAEDIREMQLAKAAIATAVDMLIAAANVDFDDIEKVYLSGGFGSYINAANAARIGLIPKELSDKIKVAGNTGLSGGILFATDEKKRALAEKIAASATYIDLAQNAEFSQKYIDYIMF
ncbi:MAG: DUF4445 domain-containing protein [Clostridiales bacterium]|nr:DUF4445 domain-containing protein [Clostridiales bacterium]